MNCFHVAFRMISSSGNTTMIFSNLHIRSKQTVSQYMFIWENNGKYNWHNVKKQVRRNIYLSLFYYLTNKWRISLIHYLKIRIFLKFSTLNSNKMFYGCFPYVKIRFVKYYKLLNVLFKFHFKYFL